MTAKFATLAGLTVAALAACSQGNAAQADLGPTVARDYDYTGFTGVALAGRHDITVTQGDRFSIRANGPREVIDHLDVYLDDGMLIVGEERDRDFWRALNDSGDRAKVTITVTMPRIDRAVVAGSGDMVVAAPTAATFDADVAGSGSLTTGAIAARQVTLDIGGSGSVKTGALNADSVKANIAGSGTVRSEGSTRRFDIDIAGSGGVIAQQLVSNDLTVDIAGSGDVKARATGTAAISISGSGSVDVMGNPRCSVSRNGVGSVRCG